MPSTFLGLNTSMSGLSYFQAALDTTSHNIANANTLGYSRQKISATAADALKINNTFGMMGTGVTMAGVERLRNDYYDVKYWSASSKNSMYSSQFEQLTQLEVYLNEMSSSAGYTKMLSNLSNAFEELANNPSDNTTRTSFVLVADSFTDMINEVAQNYQNTQKSINDELELSVSEINSLAKQIFALNKQIINIELKGGNASDLRDKRGVCLDKLSEYVDIDVEEKSIVFGQGKDVITTNATSMAVRVNGVLLVDEIEYNELMAIPREQRVSQSDIEGLVDIYWMSSDGNPSEKFNTNKCNGRLAGLVNIRDGNNGEYFNGQITSKTDTPATVTVMLGESTSIDKLNIPEQGIITLNGKDYFYDGWNADYDADKKLNNFTFLNMTMLDEKNVEITAVIPDAAVGNIGSVGTLNLTKGIPYYMAQANELVRTFSKYMNDIITQGVDKNGEPGLDLYTALNVSGEDFVVSNTMPGTGVISSSNSSYYRISALNWELNSKVKENVDKLVVSYSEDVEQGNIEAHPIIDKMIYGMTDTKMFRQGNVSQFLQSITTNLAVDINKMKVFQKNQDDIKYVIDNQRKAISSVDKNEEASNLVLYQNLYSLAAKAISVLNEVYDKLINGTGI